MNWHLIAAWAYGFFWPVVAVVVIAAACGAVTGYITLQEHFDLSVKAAWSGVFLFAALAILGGVIFAQVVS